ncbi:putative conjugative transposon membrane protein [Streptococcus cristatus]|uniref:Uncharacterized protein n=2 Tax=Streptococcus cristatus TaxID=45634 RepID=A0A512A9B5_STRCR|nr:PBECR4 domain-containing protein [Streptococcus cristatus]AGK70884.1 hypothetical protein I872_03940 [Streptococcus cristatus AS 1.3089]GEN96301.1 hypothetical protein SOL01_01750 [Streptococcus cristatus]SQI47332.1 putative conjugative transposon membrane protein [Streptococcus cristatus]
MALTKETAKNLSIISVAEQLGMELKRTGSYSYTWTEHDSFVIDARKNDFHWNSRSEFGDVIQLVQTIQEVTYKEAMHFLETGEFKKVDLAAQIGPKEPFRYSLERYEHPDFKASRSYLRDQRGLSDDTIDFFLSQGSMTEATRKKGDYFEPVIVFKYKDNTGFLAGASLQGVVENRVHYPERGRLKQIMRNSDGQLGFSVDIGKPKRLVFAEAPIDLMSYYELHKDNLQDVRLVAMDGVKEGIISRRFMELYAEMNGKAYQVDQNTVKALETVVNTTDYFKDGQHQDMITLAVDNDAAGQNFITRLQEKGIPVQIAIPPIIQIDQEKEDWNDFLKRGNEAPNELVHLYSADEESWHYQGYFSKEIALVKAQELTADDVKAFVSAKQLTKEEVHQEYTRIVNQEKERGNSMSEVHEARAEYKSERLEAIQDKVDELVIQPETQALIDSGEVKQWAKQPNIYFVKGLRRVALELSEEGRFELSPKYRPNTDEEKEVVNQLLDRQSVKEKGVSEEIPQTINVWYSTGENAVLSNLTPSPLIINNFRFESVEHAYQALKSKGFTEEALSWAESQRSAFKAGRKVQSVHQLGPTNQSNSIRLMESLLVERYRQDAAFRQALSQTKDYQITHSQDNGIWKTEFPRLLMKVRDTESRTPDTSDLSPEDAEWLKQNWDNISFSVEPKKQMVIDSDKTVTFEKPSNPLGDSSRALEENQSTEKALGKSQEQNVNSEYQKNERTNGSQGSLQPKAEGSPTPVPEVGTFERSVTSRPTLSSHLLYFSINEEFQSSNDGHYHSISSHELAKLNRPIRSQTIQNAAQYYLDELANSKVYYVTPDKTVQVNFEEKHFMHLTGIKPIGPGQTPEKTLRDFAEGNGRFDNILLANNDAAFDKLKVLSDLSVATESTSFYFDDLTDLRRYNGRFDSLIKSDDKDIILLFKELEEDNYIPVSVFQSRTKLVKELETVDRNPILGVYRERDGQIEQLSINEGLIADGGKEMMENLQRREFEEINSKEEMIQDNPERTLPSPDEKIQLHNRKDEMDRDLDGDGISNSDEMLQGTDPYNAASNLHKKQEERERRIDAEVAAGAIITEAVATKNSERSISQMVAEKDTKALAEHLKEGMKNYLDSDQFKSFLDTMSKFHNYSLNNIHLLKMQNPNVTQVASFNKWKTDFDRTVKKGAKALKIWVPYQVKTKIPENQKELNFSPSENEMDQKEITVTRFKLGNVFDVSQTEGKELPKAIHELTGSVKDYEDLYRAAKAVSMENQVPISFEEIKRENTRGYYSPNENRIVISKKLKGEEHILKTIFHEMAHADLHKGTNAQYGDDQYRKQELQAESVAYVVASHFGFDTSSYSFGYLAIWAKDKNGFEDMVEQLQVVQKEAKSLIDRMDAKLELVKNKTVVKDKFADKLQQAKEQSEKLSNQKAEAVKQVEEKKSLSSPH